MMLDLPLGVNFHDGNGKIKFIIRLFFSLLVYNLLGRSFSVV